MGFPFDVYLAEKLVVLFPAPVRKDPPAIKMKYLYQRVLDL